MIPFNLTIKNNDMKRQFSLLTILLLVFSYTIALAQNADAQVKEIVKSFRDHKNVEISFNYQYVTDANNRSEWQEGKAYLQGEAYKVIMKEQENSSDGTTIWCYLVDDEEVMVSNATEGTDNTPLKLLGTLDEDYAAVAKDNYTFELTNPKGDFKKVILSRDRKRPDLLGVEVFADDGSSLVLSINEIKYDLDLDDSFFTFDEKAHPEVDVIDMR